MNTRRLDNALNILKEIHQDLSQFSPFKKILSKWKFPEKLLLKWPSLQIGDLTARLPIIQGGMGVGISLSGLASAVANAGGIGIIAANGIGLLEKDYYKDGRAANIKALREEIRKARKNSTGLIGVNIMVAVNDFHQLLDTAIEEKVDLIIMGAGLPIKNLPIVQMRKNNVKAAPIVSSARAAEMIFKMWKKIYNDVPDAVIFEGPKAGGHLGFKEEQLEDPAYQLESIVPQLVEVLKPFEEEMNRSIPVIAGGGVYSGEDIHQVLSLGASGVQMGTRFVATEECDADEKFKEAYINCRKEDLGIIKSPVGMPGRAIRNQFIHDSEEGKRPSFRCAWQCLAFCKADAAQYCISIALNNARRGKLNQGFAFAGTNAYRIDKIVSVQNLIGELTLSYKKKAKEMLGLHLEELSLQIREMVDQYKNLGKRKKELGQAYDSALLNFIKETQDGGIEILRNQYENILGNLRHLQFTISEGIALCRQLMNRIVV